VVSFVASLLIAGLMTGVAFEVGRRRKPGQLLTWGEAFVAATFLFGMFILIYGIVPNQWLKWADNELQWRKDSYFIAPGTKLHKATRIVVPKEAVRDIIAMGIYGVALFGHFWLWAWWQRRGKAKAGAPEVERSSFGRPLLRAPEAADEAESLKGAEMAGT
jgi:uncharacterized iron-regulated membrane protein